MKKKKLKDQIDRINDDYEANRITSETKKAAYCIQRRYNNVSKTARTIFEREGKILGVAGWRLRTYDTVISESVKKEEEKIQYIEPSKTAYVKIINDVPFDIYYIVYVQ